MYRFIALFGLLVASVVSEDFLNGECGTELNDFLGCVIANGVTDETFTDVFAEGCQSCIDTQNNANVDAEFLPCDELVELVVGSLDACQAECALEGCTNEVNAVLTCFTITQSTCSNNTGAPSASPSADTGGSGGGFGAFFAVIQELIPLLIEILNFLGGGSR